MVPCDNWQLSLITRQGPKISLRKWPALWDVVQRVNKDKSIHLRKLLRKQDKGWSRETTCCAASGEESALEKKLNPPTIGEQRAYNFVHPCLEVANGPVCILMCACLLWRACMSVHTRIRHRFVCRSTPIFLCYCMSDLSWLAALI